MISREVISAVRDHMRIEEVVGDYVTLKRKGQNEWACCPFHQEKSPSFSVAPAKGIYKCFGCGKAGDAITFIMEIEGVGYTEAIKVLAKKYGIEVVETAPDPGAVQEQNERESLLIVMNYANRFFQDQLNKGEEGTAIGKSYFVERGYHESTIQTFQLGFAPTAGDALYKSATQQGYKEEHLLAAGLISDKEGRKYDRFRGRVTFPIQNLSGKVIAFGARILTSDKNQPKYLNSPETLLYHKSQILYGISQARQAIRQHDECYLVEGYTDVLTLHQAGVQNVVASSGTSLTLEQIRLIKRYTNNVTVLYDGDNAGIKASFRGIDLLLQESMNVRAVSFPQGEDPDSYCRKVGPTAFVAYLKAEVTDFLAFTLKLKLTETGSDPLKKAEIISDIVASIALIEDAIKRAVYIKECAKLLDIGEEVLLAELNKRLIKKRKEQQKEQQGQNSGILESLKVTSSTPSVAPDYEALLPKKDLRVGYEREIVRLLLSYGHLELDEGRYLFSYLMEELSDVLFADESYARLMHEYLHQMEYSPGENLSNYFVSSDDKELQKLSIDLLTQKYEISKRWINYEIEVPLEQDILTHVVMTTLIRLKWQHVRKLLEDNLLQLEHPENVEQEEISQKIHLELKRTEKQLAEKLGIVIYKS